MDRPAIAIVGAGPRGAGLLERVAASVVELLPQAGATALDVHLIDPFPAGAGRIWRHDQSPLLAMNSMAADVTMFTDASVHCEGPIVPGPSLWDWAQDLRSGRLADADENLRPGSPPSCAPSPPRRSRPAACKAPTWPGCCGTSSRAYRRGPGADPRVPGRRAHGRPATLASSSTWRAVRRCGSTPSSWPQGTSTPHRPRPSVTSPSGPPLRVCGTCLPSRRRTATCPGSSRVSR